MSFPGRINEYRCDDCEGVMVTVDKDEGDTPYFTHCLLLISKQVDATTRLSGGPCGGRCHSAMYDCDQNRTARYEWYMPGAGEHARLRGFNKWKADHGQLLLRQR